MEMMTRNVKFVELNLNIVTALNTKVLKMI